MSIQGMMLIDLQYFLIWPIPKILVVFVERVMSPVPIWLHLRSWDVTSICVQGQTPPQLSIFLAGIFFLVPGRLAFLARRRGTKPRRGGFFAQEGELFLGFQFPSWVFNCEAGGP